MNEDNVKNNANLLDNSNFSNKLYQKFEIGKIIYTIILNGKQNDGKYSLIEIEFPSGKEKEIPLHKHTKENIIIYVTEGKFSIQIGNENINAGPGIVLTRKEY